MRIQYSRGRYLRNSPEIYLVEIRTHSHLWCASVYRNFQTISSANKFYQIMNSLLIKFIVEMRCHETNHVNWFHLSEIHDAIYPYSNQVCLVEVFPIDNVFHIFFRSTCHTRCIRCVQASISIICADDRKTLSKRCGLSWKCVRSNGRTHLAHKWLKYSPVRPTRSAINCNVSRVIVGGTVAVKTPHYYRL